MLPTPPVASAPPLESSSSWRNPLAPNESSSSGQGPPKARQYTDSPNYKDETSIDLKGVRNLHIFFNDESSVRVQNEHDEGDGTLEAVTVAPGNSQRSDDGSSTSWHIKIGKSSGNESCTVNTPRYLLLISLLHSLVFPRYLIFSWIANFPVLVENPNLLKPFKLSLVLNT